MVTTGTTRAGRQAYAACERLAQSHYENFPVASRLLPAQLRPHVAAIYAFARTADDFADEPGCTPSERLRLLDDWRDTPASRRRRRRAGCRRRPRRRGSHPDAIFIALARHHRALRAAGARCSTIC